MSVIVYDHPLSPYAQKVKIALLEREWPSKPRFPRRSVSAAPRGLRDHESMLGARADRRRRSRVQSDHPGVHRGSLADPGAPAGAQTAPACA